MATASCSPEGERPAEEESVNEEEQEDEEAQLRRAHVQTLLETMNKASEDVNKFERQVGESRTKHKRLFEVWGRLHGEIRARHGPAIDRVRPYFDTTQALEGASQHAQAAVRAFSAASSSHTQAKAELRTVEERLAYGAHQVMLDNDMQEGLSRATVRVLRCQEERDECERQTTRALKECQEVQAAETELRTRLGEDLVRHTLPDLRLLHQQQMTLMSERRRTRELADKAAAAKKAYGDSMRELERISNAVHDARKASRTQQSDQRSVAASSESGYPDSQRPPPRRAESPPEVSPEVPPELSPECLQEEPTYSDWAETGRCTDCRQVFGDDSPKLTPVLAPSRWATTAAAATVPGKDEFILKDSEEEVVGSPFE